MSTDEPTATEAKPDMAASNAEAPLSKRALKRRKKREEWLASKADRRAREKRRRKEKLAEKIKEGRHELSYHASRKKLKEKKMSESRCQIGVVLDMTFDHLMHQRDLGKCCKQLLHCYSINRRLPDPMQLHVAGLRGRGLEEMEKHEGFKNWDVKFHEKPYHEALPKDKLVYLTSESNNTLTDLEGGKLYVIGGLVDHNAHKGLCHRLAVGNGVAHARLPIDEYVQMKTRKVLTIDHVFQILSSVSEGKDWAEAFLGTLPDRKGAKQKKQKRDKVNNVDDAPGVGEGNDAQSAGEDGVPLFVEEDTAPENNKGSSDNEQV